jgi:membrane protein
MARSDEKASDDGCGQGRGGGRGDLRGRDAASPTEIPLRGWRDIAIRSWREAASDNIELIAAGVAFYGFLALVPMLGALVLTYGLVADQASVTAHARAAFSLLPPDAARLVADQLLQLSAQSAGKTGLGLLLSLAIALYGAMRGASAILVALNIAYDEVEERSLVARTALALAITIGTVVIAVVALAAIGSLALLDSLYPAAPAPILLIVRLLFWSAAAALASVGVAMLYRCGPDRHSAKWRWLSPGSIVATAAWIVMTFGFGLYSAHVAHYDATYGALGAVVALLMWLYLSAYILLFGAELNGEIERQTEEDTTKGPSRPMGRRQAFVADTVGEVP